jgi:chromate transporter
MGGGARTPLSELARLFLKLGAIGFGGPAAHIALMEDEVVRRRQWLTREEFLDFVGATNVIPGPNSTELAIHIGQARRGWPGLVVSGVSFIVPAALIVTAIAWAYVRFGTLPQLTGVLYGVKPVVIVVVLQALWALARTAVKSLRLGVIGVICVAAVVAGMNEILVLVAAGGAGAILRTLEEGRGDDGHGAGGASAAFAAGPVGGAVGFSGATVAGMSSLGLWPLFAVFLKVGAILFGSGYVLLAFLRADLVQRLGWMTERQLLDAVAVGQVTPGPLFTTATFAGYVIAGGAGAAAATLGIFLPAFVFVALSGPLVPRIRRSPRAGAALDGINVASLALMVVVTVQLGRAALPDLASVGIGVAALIFLHAFRLNSTWLVLGGACVGLALRL